MENRTARSSWPSSHSCTDPVVGLSRCPTQVDLLKHQFFPEVLLDLGYELREPDPQELTPRHRPAAASPTPEPESDDEVMIVQNKSLSNASLTKSLQRKKEKAKRDQQAAEAGLARLEAEEQARGAAP